MRAYQRCTVLFPVLLVRTYGSFGERRLSLKKNLKVSCEPIGAELEIDKRRPQGENLVGQNRSGEPVAI